MEPFHNHLMRETLRQSRELRDLLDNSATRAALQFQRQYGDHFAAWNRVLSSSTFQFLREREERHSRHLDDLISLSAFSATRDFLMHNLTVRREFDSQIYRTALHVHERQHDLLAITNLTTVKAVSEVTRFIRNNISFPVSSGFFAIEIMSSLAAMEEPVDEQTFQDFRAGLENLLSLIIEKCQELAVNPTSYWSMVKFAFTIFMFLYPLYEGHQTEKRITDSVNQTQSRILSEIEKLKPTELREAHYVVDREAKLKSQPRPKSLTIQVLSRNQTLRLVKAKGRWIYVEYFDYVEGMPKTGWVLKKYAHRIDLSPEGRSSTQRKISTLEVSETALLSEQALSEDWNRPEEDAAWSHLQ